MVDITDDDFLALNSDRINHFRNPNTWYDTGVIDSLLEQQRAYCSSNVAVIRSSSASRRDEYSNLHHVQPKTDLVYKCVFSTGSNVTDHTKAKPSILKNNIKGDLNTLLKSTSEPCTFSFIVNTGNHFIPITCNKQGEILVIDTMSGNYDSYIEEAISGIQEAMMENGIRPQSSIKKTGRAYQQPDTSSCGRLSTLVASTIDSSKSLREQADEVAHKVAYAVKNINVVIDQQMTIYQENLLRSRKKEGKAPYYDLSKDQELNTRLSAVRNIQRAQRDFGVQIDNADDATLIALYQQKSEERYSEEKPKIIAFRDEVNRAYPELAFPVTKMVNEPPIAPNQPFEFSDFKAGLERYFLSQNIRGGLEKTLTDRILGIAKRYGGNIDDYRISRKGDSWYMKCNNPDSGLGLRKAVAEVFDLATIHLDENKNYVLSGAAIRDDDAEERSQYRP